MLRLAGPLLGLLLLAWATSGAVQVREDAAISPVASVPVLLAAGSAGSTSLGSSGTSASTTGVSLPALGSAQSLQVLRGTTDWNVQVQAVSVTGQGVLDSMTVSLVGSTTQAQVVVTLGTVTQSIGTAVALAAAGPDLQIIAAGTCLGSCSFTLQVLLAPTGSASPALAYPYTLAVT